LPKRFAKYGLEINTEKTTVVRFGRPQRSSAERQPGTFSFLGFVHYWGKTWRGSYTIKRKTEGKRLRRSLGEFWRWCRDNRHRSLQEGVSKVLMCYDRPRDGRKRNTCIMARHNDHPSATLPQLSRHRYRPTWEDPSRQATLSLPREGLCGSHLPAGVCLCRSIARGEATDCR